MKSISISNTQCIKIIIPINYLNFYRAGLLIYTSKSTAHTSTMQLQIRGQQTTIVECEDNEKIQHIKVLKV